MTADDRSRLGENRGVNLKNQHISGSIRGTEIKVSPSVTPIRVEIRREYHLEFSAFE